MALFDYSNPLANNGQQYAADSPEGRARKKAYADMRAGGLYYNRATGQTYESLELQQQKAAAKKSSMPTPAKPSVEPLAPKPKTAAQLAAEEAKRLNPDLIRTSKNPALSAITDDLTKSLAGMVKDQGTASASMMADQTASLDRIKKYTDEDISAMTSNLARYGQKSEALDKEAREQAGKARDISTANATGFMERYGAKTPGMGASTDLYRTLGQTYQPIELDYMTRVNAVGRDALEKLSDREQAIVGKRGLMMGQVADRSRDLAYEPVKFLNNLNPALQNLTNTYNAQNFLGVGMETGQTPYVVPTSMAPTGERLGQTPAYSGGGNAGQYPSNSPSRRILPTSNPTRQQRPQQQRPQQQQPPQQQQAKLSAAQLYKNQTGFWPTQDPNFSPEAYSALGGAVASRNQADQQYFNQTQVWPQRDPYFNEELYTSFGGGS